MLGYNYVKFTGSMARKNPSLIGDEYERIIQSYENYRDDMRKNNKISKSQLGDKEEYSYDYLLRILRNEFDSLTLFSSEAIRENKKQLDLTIKEYNKFIKRYMNSTCSVHKGDCYTVD